jgi:hypothetical protein
MNMAFEKSICEARIAVSQPTGKETSPIAEHKMNSYPFPFPFPFPTIGRS